MKLALVAAAALAFAAVAAGGTPAGRIVFAATDAPLNDDVMLVRANGTEVDLSKSPALDTMPVVSPNGKLVAFYSTRSGYGAEWVVGIDGTKPRRVTPSIPTTSAVSWAPNSRDLAAVGARSRLYRASAAGGVWARIDRGDGAQQLVGWSHDGTRVAYVDGLDDVHVVTRAGKPLFEVNGETAVWSSTGRLAAKRNSLVWDVYGESGRHLAAIPAETVAWSSDGRLASVTPGGVLQVRPGGAGAPTFSMRGQKDAQPVWAGPSHVLLAGLSYDLVHKAVFVAPAAYRVAPALARDGSAYAEYPFDTLVRSTLSGSTRKVASVPYCEGKDADAFAYLQALPDGSGAVFAGECAPPHDLFSIAPGGSGLTRITSTPADELDPAVSPDGARLAFTRVDGADCAGCDHVIWTTRLDGSDAASVSLPARTDDPILEDDHASFSPDGTKVVFSRWISSVSDQGVLYEAPSTGGAATSLKLFGGYPAWGPSAIAFTGAHGVETVAPGSTRAKVVPGVGKDAGFPAWSSAGRLAVLDVADGGALSIVLPAANGHIALPGLRIGVGGGAGLAWSPDGTRLAFTAADREGVGDVWTIGVDGKGLTRVTHDLGAEGALAWR